MKKINIQGWRIMMIPKFRAWDKTHNKLGLIDGDIMSGMFQSLKIFDESDDDFQESENFCIMQSTGLFDKNGVEIFEGDIVTASGYEFIGVGVVRYEDSLASFVVEFIDKELIEKPQFICQFRELEVIGNVHENKELLE